jgi:hypothetical protein
VLLELLALEIAAEQVTRAELADAEIVEGARTLERRKAPELLPSYFQLRAPRRQT